MTCLLQECPAVLPLAFGLGGFGVRGFRLAAWGDRLGVSASPGRVLRGSIEHTGCRQGSILGNAMLFVRVGHGAVSEKRFIPHRSTLLGRRDTRLLSGRLRHCVEVGGRVLKIKRVASWSNTDYMQASCINYLTYSLSGFQYSTSTVLR